MTRRRLLVALGLLGFLVVATGSYLLARENLSDRTTTDAPRQRPPGEGGASVSRPGERAEEGPEDGGTPLSGSSAGLIGSVVSTRNLQGLLVQVNQIDVCTAPQLTAFATLTNQEGANFTDVRKEDFEVSVDGRVVQAFDFALVRTQDLPLSTILVIDHSGSMAGEPLERAKDAATGYLDRLRPQDQVGLVQFDTQIDVLSEVTPDRARVAGLIAGITPRSDTAIYDAVAVAVEKAPPCGRKAVVVLTDGRDTASKLNTLEKALERANVENIPVFVVGLRSPQFTPETLRQIADGTGAQYFEAPTPQELDALYRRINDQLAGQYVFRFTLDVPRTNEQRRLKISSTVRGSPTVSEKSFVF